jgi:hypothetical protein
MKTFLKIFLKILKPIRPIRVALLWVALAFAPALLAFTACTNIFQAEVSTNVTTDNLLRTGYSGALLQMRGSYQRLANVMDDIIISGEVASDNAEECGGFTSQRDMDYGEFYNFAPEVNLIYAGLHDARGQADLFLTQYINSYDLTLNYTDAAVPVATRKLTMTAYAQLIRGWATMELGMLFTNVNFNRGPAVSAEEALRRAAQDFTAIEAAFASSTPPEAVFEGIDLRRAAATLNAKTQLQLGAFDASIQAASGGYTATSGGVSAAGAVTIAFLRTASNISTIDGNLIFTLVGNSANAQKQFAMNKWFIQNDSLEQRIALDSTLSTGQKFVFNAAVDLEVFRGYVLGYRTNATVVTPRTPTKYSASTVQARPLRLLSWQDNTLTWAEALIRKGDLQGGIAKLNELRATAKNDRNVAVPLRTVSSRDAALNDILWERRVEFMCEGADRFITLRRFAVPHYESKAQYALPIPNTEEGQ